MLFVPFHTVIKLDTRASEAVQGASYREIHLPIAETLDKLQVFEVSAASGIGHRYRAPLRELLDERLINTLLQALVISRVDEKLGAVWLQGLDGG